MNETELHKRRLELRKQFLNGEITVDEHLIALTIAEEEYNMENEAEIDDMIEANILGWY